MTCPPAGDNERLPTGVAWGAESNRFLAPLRIPAAQPALGPNDTDLWSGTLTGGSWSFSNFTLPGVELVGNGSLAPAGDLVYWAELASDGEGGVGCYLTSRYAVEPYPLVSLITLLPSPPLFGQFTDAYPCPPLDASALKASRAVGGSSLQALLMQRRQPLRGTVRVRAN